MYGLPIIHKPDTLFRPILAAYKTPSYRLAKLLVPLLQNYTLNECHVKLTFILQKNRTHNEPSK